MILQFLRLFRDFRDIEVALAEFEENAELEQSRLRAQMEQAAKDLTAWRDKAEAWEQRYLEAVQDAMRARERMADYLACQKTGRNVFERGPVLPEEPPPDLKPIPRPWIHPRIAVNRAKVQLQKDYTEYVKKKRDEARLHSLAVAEGDRAVQPFAAPEEVPAS